MLFSVGYEGKDEVSRVPRPFNLERCRIGWNAEAGKALLTPECYAGQGNVCHLVQEGDLLAFMTAGVALL